MLKTRVLVAVVALPIVIALVALGDWPFAVAVFAALLLGGDEYVRLLRQSEFRPPEWLILALITLAFGAAWFDRPEWHEPGLVLLLIAALFYAVWKMEHGSPRPVLDAALAVFGGTYLGWLGSRLLAVRLLDDGAYWTLFLYFCVIISDSAAYFIGRQFGRHKMSPRVSPKKSWEGYAASVVSGLLVGMLGAVALDIDGLTVGHGAVIGLSIGVLGTLGDLGISAIKRQAGAKDSSRLIPGHGGILDRTDSVLIAATVGYYYIVWFVT
ncbi:MAG: phosphatidate cytidylyltransferase [Anaerolineae bacterium]|nr:phosphatidate cytidylyltransferase [Anaerolineae bacterium]